MTKEIAVSKINQVRDFMTAQRGEFEKVLPSHVNAEKFIRVVMTACVNAPELLEADRATLMLSALKCASDGLLPDNREAAFIIFNSKDKNGVWVKKVQYMPMYTGILKKVRQSSDISNISSRVVFEKDFFEYELGDEEKLTHKPYMGKDSAGEIVAAYCVVKLNDGSVYREVMTVGEIEKVRRCSKSGNKDGQAVGIWKEWYEEMARKTVFKRAAKWLPQSIELPESEYDFEREDVKTIENEKPSMHNYDDRAEEFLKKRSEKKEQEQPVEVVLGDEIPEFQKQEEGV